MKDTTPLVFKPGPFIDKTLQQTPTKMCLHTTNAYTKDYNLIMYIGFFSCQIIFIC